MAGELVERLRGDYENWSLGSKGPEILREAADRIEALERENATLRAERDEARKALEPFGQMAEVYDGNEDTDPVLAVLHQGVRVNLTVGDRFLAAAIRNMGGEG